MKATFQEDREPKQKKKVGNGKKKIQVIKPNRPALFGVGVTMAIQ